MIHTLYNKLKVVRIRNCGIFRDSGKSGILCVHVCVMCACMCDNIKKRKEKQNETQTMRNIFKQYIVKSRKLN